MEYLKQKIDKSVKDNILSGVTVALALVPEAIAFSFIAGVDPVIGLTSAFIIALIASVFGGRPGMISGATGAIAIVVAPLVASHGIGYMVMAVILMGIIQVLAGVFKLGKLVSLIPHPVMIGFVNGLAIVIFLAQLEHFKTGDHWLGANELLIMGGLICFTMALIKLFPKITKAIPATLVAIGATTGLVLIFKIDTRTVGDLADISGGLPQLTSFFVPFSLDVLKVIAPYSLMMAIVGLSESLMTLTLIDDITNTKGDANRECIGQGIANVVLWLVWRNGWLRDDWSEHAQHQIERNKPPFRDNCGAGTDCHRAVLGPFDRADPDCGTGRHNVCRGYRDFRLDLVCQGGPDAKIRCPGYHCRHCGDHHDQPGDCGSHRNHHDIPGIRLGKREENRIVKPSG